MDSPRKIIHIDMDAFYASVEQRDNPEYRGKPLAVGGSRERGVVAAASYEARKFGVHSAMASSIAYRKCPEIIFVKPRFDVYKSVSRQIREIFLDYTDLVEPLSLDEAYLDVTHNFKNMPSATLIAKEIKQRIKAATGLTASAGVSINKFLAKVASDYKKPDGLYLIEPHRAESFVAELPISKFYGVGKVTAEKMLQLGIYNGATMKTWTEEDLVKHFGKTGRYYYQICRGIDHREVSPNRIRKSLGTETTYDTDLIGTEALLNELPALAAEVEARLKKAGFKGKTLTLKVKFSNFEQITRSKTVNYPITEAAVLEKLGRELMQLFDSSEARVRLLGLTVSNGQESELGAGAQLSIDFDDPHYLSDQ